MMDLEILGKMQQRKQMINKMILELLEILKMQNKIFQSKKMNGMNLVKTKNSQMNKKM